MNFFKFIYYIHDKLKGPEHETFFTGFFEFFDNFLLTFVHLISLNFISKNEISRLDFIRVGRTRKWKKNFLKFLENPINNTY